jgi:hypothetical protein
MPYPVVIDHYAYLDFDRSAGAYTSDEDVTGDVLTPPGVTITVGRDTPRAFSPPAANICGWTLNNEAGDYSNLFPGSPHYGLMTRGAPGEFGIAYGTDVGFNDPAVDFNAYDVLFSGTSYRTLFKGILDKPEETYGIGSFATRCQLLGSLSTIVNASVTTQAVSVNKFTGEVINIILDDIGWPAGKRIIATGTVLVLLWWANGQNALNLLIQMMLTEGPGAVLYEDELGNIVFRDKNYREQNNPRSLISQATFADTSLGGDQGFDSFEIGFNDVAVLFNGDPPRSFYYSGDPTIVADPDSVINDVTARVNTRVLTASPIVLWQYGQSITIGSSGTFEVFVSMPDDPAQNVVTPLAGTDFTATPALTGVAVSTLSGSTVKITLTADAGGSTVTGLQLRGNTYQKVGETILKPTLSPAQLAASVSRYGYKPWDAPIWPELNPNTAQDLVNAYATRYLDIRPQFTFDVYMTTPEVQYVLMQLGISDRVTVFSRRQGISSDIWIDRFDYQAINRNVFLVRITGEAIYQSTVARWDKSTYDINHPTDPTKLAGRWGY